MNCYICNQIILPEFVEWSEEESYIRNCPCPYQKIILKNNIIRYYDFDYIHDDIKYRIRGLVNFNNEKYSELSEYEDWNLFTTKWIPIKNTYDIHDLFKKLKKQRNFQ